MIDWKRIGKGVLVSAIGSLATVVIASSVSGVVLFVAPAVLTGIASFASLSGARAHKIVQLAIAVVINWIVIAVLTFAPLWLQTGLMSEDAYVFINPEALFAGVLGGLVAVLRDRRSRTEGQAWR